MPKIILLGLLSLMFYSCTKHEISELNISNSYFPNDLGDYWIYKLTGEGGKIDTVKVMIVGETILLTGEKASICQYDYGTSIDTNYIVSKNNSITVFSSGVQKIISTPEKTVLIKYLFPLNLDHELQYNNLNTKVYNQIDIDVEVGRFLNCFELSHINQGISLYSINDTIVFKESIGIIKLKQKHFDIGPLKGNGEWELIEYHLK